MRECIDGYYLLEFRSDRHGGEEPDIPDGIGFAQIGSPGNDPGWSLYECWGTLDDEPLPKTCVPVPERLRVLIESAKHYPPALALARGDVGSTHVRTREEFAEHLARALERRLSEQPEEHFFMAKAKESYALGGLSAGQYAWLIAYDPDRRLVWWVTFRDYFAYDASPDLFEVSEEQLLRLTR